MRTETQPLLTLATPQYFQADSALSDISALPFTDEMSLHAQQAMQNARFTLAAARRGAKRDRLREAKLRRLQQLIEAREEAIQALPGRDSQCKFRLSAQKHL